MLIKDTTFLVLKDLQKENFSTWLEASKQKIWKRNISNNESSRRDWKKPNLFGLEYVFCATFLGIKFFFHLSKGLWDFFNTRKWIFINWKLCFCINFFNYSLTLCRRFWEFTRYRVSWKKRFLLCTLSIHFLTVFTMIWHVFFVGKPLNRLDKRLCWQQFPPRFLQLKFDRGFWSDETFQLFIKICILCLNLVTIPLNC